MAETSRNPFHVPKRGSSKTATIGQAAELENNRISIEAEIKGSRKRLKVQSSFDAQYWLHRTSIAELQARQVAITRKISLRDFAGKTEDWKETPEAKDYLQQENAFLLDAKLCKRQAERLDTLSGDESKSIRRAFMQLFTSAKTGLGIGSSAAGRRDSSLQSKFRQDLIELSKARNPLPQMRNFLWCCVTRQWLPEESVTAAHIFAYHHGQDVMDAIFGKDPKNTNSLFSAENGLLMSTQAEAKFDKGYMVIVPALPDDASLDAINEWHTSSKKNFKIRVVDPKGHLMDTLISQQEQRTWSDLDGQLLTFQSNFRPRARYLYYHYCCAMLKKAWVTPSSGALLRDELGKRYWGTPGPYLRKAMLLAFVEEMGHDSDMLLDGAEDKTSTTEPVETALAAAIDDIRLSYKKSHDVLSYGYESGEEDDLSEDSGE